MPSSRAVFGYLDEIMRDNEGQLQSGSVEATQTTSQSVGE